MKFESALHSLIRVAQDDWYLENIVKWKEKPELMWPDCGAREISETSSFIPPCAPSFRRLRAVRKLRPPPIDVGSTLGHHPPPRNLILPLQKCNRTIERSRRKEENGPAMATRAIGRSLGYQFLRWPARPRASVFARTAACACSHTVAHLHAMHYACTPSSRRDAPRAPRRSLSLARAHARTHARTHACTHAHERARKSVVT